MFERFTQGAREIVVGAQTEARALAAGVIGTEHLLLAMTDDRGPAGAALRRAALGHDRLADRIRLVMRTPTAEGELDAEALEHLGIDLEAVRHRVEEVFGEGALEARERPWRGRLRRRRARTRVGRGHIPFGPPAKKVLELSLREAMFRRDRHIGSEHLLLGLIREGEGLAVLVLVDLGVNLDDLRRLVEQEIRRAA